MSKHKEPPKDAPAEPQDAPIAAEIASIQAELEVVEQERLSIKARGRAIQDRLKAKLQEEREESLASSRPKQTVKAQ